MKKVWMLWALVTLLGGAYLAKQLLVDEHKEAFLIGDASHGHFQIQLECTACHVEPFGGQEIIQGACESCHSEELEQAHDSHPKKKFTDPRNADRLKVVDARYCVSCHTEHKEEQTHNMGVTLPDDYCFHCHQEVIEERPSHKNLGFETCASSGCHNYHDNRALYEDYLVEHAGGAWLKAMPELIKANYAKQFATKPLGNDSDESAVTKPRFSEDLLNIQAEKMQSNSEHAAAIAADVHGQAGLMCLDCHQQDSVNTVSENKAATVNWLDKPGVNACSSCHQAEANEFLASKHGMRMAQDLSPLTPATIKNSEARFHEAALDSEQGCNACHKAHEFKREVAATQSCLTCHADEHSQGFEQSKHAQVILPNDDAMSCATCHMPVFEQAQHGKKVHRVQHNQNNNLRPNEKMIRGVCMDCHNLEFSIDALADEMLIKSNFSARPTVHIESIDWALERAKQ